jgi:ATP-dependent RNA helicase HelY
MNRRRSIQELKEQFLEGVGVPPAAAFVVDDFQRAAIDHVANGSDTLVVAPTGSGKTYIALEAIRAVLAQGKRAVYTTPLKALSNTKFADLKTRFEPQYRVGLLTGDRKIEGNADVVVATTEIYRNELYRTSERYGLVVLDEVHFIADQQRGPVWEESIILTPSTSTLLMLSASISNAVEIAEWLLEVRGKECQIVSKRERPVQLRYGFMHPELGVIPLSDERGQVIREVLNFYEHSELDRTGRKVMQRGRGNSRGYRPKRGGRRR